MPVLFPWLPAGIERHKHERNRRGYRRSQTGQARETVRRGQTGLKERLERHTGEVREAHRKDQRDTWKKLERDTQKRPERLT